MAGPAPRPASADNPPGRFFGMLLMVSGGLIAGLSGLCTAAVTLTMLVQLAVSHSGLTGFLNLVGLALVFGGVPFAFGAVLFILGRNLYRASKPPTPNVAKTFE